MSGTTGNQDGGQEAARAARIGGARADFVSSLGRRIGELRTVLNGLEQDPGLPRLRDDLRRRVHALSAGARLLRFSGMATALAEVERMLDRAASVGGLARSELREISEILEHLPSFANSEPPYEQRATERPPASAPIGETAIIPPTILVIGPSGLADAITNAIDHAGEGDMECERCETPAAGLELARALAPDVAVIDADLPGAKDLVETLGKDTQSEPTPLLVVGTWATPEEGARWVAAGATLALAKPISPYDLRKACMELSLGKAKPTTQGPLGVATVEGLTELIIGEIKRGLPDALVQGKSTPIQLGDGSDVLAAVWGAVARVRDLLMIKSGGAVRFSTQGPEGALPIAPWWGESHKSGPHVLDPKRVEGRLDGRAVVVADDDPAVTWFIGGLLRAAGAEVREAHDGDRALELCFRLSPDLVISDVLMPGLDGFALSRALKRDIALRDVPVILLSWKEDLLQRLRDLGADADGYLRKEASAAAILQRVHEVLRTRARIEARLKGDGEVRGRLDGVTPATLLHTIERVRPDARLCIRDASFLYEVELRGGAPRSATRTTSDGTFQRGTDVFAALLGVRTGRYVVSRANGNARGTLEGDLATQMEQPLAHARAALRLLGGTRLLEVHRVTIALDRVLAYLGATPEPARSLLHRLAKGASPRELILGGEVAPAHLEEVLGDLAARGAVTGVHGAGGADLLGPALEHELVSIRRGGNPSRPPRRELKRTSTDREPAPKIAGVTSHAPPRTAASGATPAPAAVSAAPPPLPPKTSAPAPADTVPAGVPLGKLRLSVAPRKEATASSDAVVSNADVEAAEPSPPSSATGDGDRAPSSLEAALIRQVSDRTPPPPAVEPAGAAASIVDTSELKARIPGTPLLRTESPGPIPSLPPDAIVPASASDEKIKTAELSSAAVVPSGSDDRIHASIPPITGEAIASLRPKDLASPQARERSVPPPPREPKLKPPLPAPARGRAAEAPARQPSRSAFPIALVVALGLLGAGLFFLESQSGRSVDSSSVSTSSSAMSTNAPTRAVASEIATVASASSPSVPSPFAERVSDRTDPPSTAPSSSASATQPAGEDLPLPTGAVLTPGQGLLDIETGAREAIFVDGVELGRGPFLRLTLTPGVHEVRLRAHGEERIRFVLIRAARRTRLPLSSAWVR
jgi:CheY-like chemotaxis protein